MARVFDDIGLVASSGSKVKLWSVVRCLWKNIFLEFTVIPGHVDYNRGTWDKYGLLGVRNTLNFSLFSPARQYTSGYYIFSTNTSHRRLVHMLVTILSVGGHFYENVGYRVYHSFIFLSYTRFNYLFRIDPLPYATITCLGRQLSPGWQLL